jgi:hypothetical protein
MADVAGAPETSVNLQDRTCSVPAEGSSSHDFELVPELDPNWPGLMAPTGQMRADPERMREALQQLDSVIGEVERIPTQLTSQTRAVVFGPPRWAMANTLTWAHGQLGSAVTEYTERILGALLAGRTAIARAIDTIEGSDTQNRVNSSTVSAQMGGSNGGGNGDVVVF